MVIDLPTSLSKRDALLRKLFKEHVYDAVRRNGEIKIYNRRDQFDFGDVIVEGPNDTFLFVTYVVTIEREPPGPASLFVSSTSGWTKDSVLAQLPCPRLLLGFKAEQIPNDVMQEWVDAEHELKEQFLTEEAYEDALSGLNKTLMSKTLKAISENSSL